MEKHTVNIDIAFDLNETSQQIAGLTAVIKKLKVPWKFLTPLQRKDAISSSASIKKLQALKLELLDFNLDL
tara:strand:- start:31 stop:243 length:213 start_codon:yes stop_codon:yes gene_type:complete